MSRTTIYSPLEMMERIFNNTNPVIEDRKYFIEEDETEFVLEIPVSGFTRKDISIDVETDFLVIKGEDNGSRWTNSFTKKFKLTSKVDSESINAKIEDGVLKISIGKKKESIAKKIKIS